MNVKLLAFLFLWPLSVMAQGFSGLGADVEGFATPLPAPAFNFPEDHGAHTDYRIEWWYLIGQAGVQATPFRAWIDEWALQGADFDSLKLSANGPDFGYDMALEAQGPLVFHGDRGYSVKSAEGQASYYYSQPFYKMRGALTLPTGEIAVTGDAWLDREWSSQPLSENQSGWDWFSLSFADGAKLMGFQLRQDDGPGYSASTWIAPDGTTTPYGDGAFAAAPLATYTVAGRDVPTKWRVTLPVRDVDVVVKALNPDAWMGLSIPYWEGPVKVSGSHAGQGYLEMTGYE